MTHEKGTGDHWNGYPGGRQGDLERTSQGRTRDRYRFVGALPSAAGDTGRWSGRVVAAAGHDRGSATSYGTLACPHLDKTTGGVEHEAQRDALQAGAAPGRQPLPRRVNLPDLLDRAMRPGMSHDLEKCALRRPGSGNPEQLKKSQNPAIIL
jgi:hypothetical protein